MQSYLTNVDYSSIVKTITFQPGGSIVHDFHFSGDCTINGICSIESVPTKGIGINVLDAENKELLYQTDSLFDGFYMIPNLASGDYIIEAYCGTQGCGGSAVEIISLSTEESKSLDFNLTRESLNGKISDTMNNPLSFSDIELIPVEGERTYSTTANRDGSYKFVNVKEGEYYIAVRADEYAEENRGPMLLGGSYPSKTENFHLSEGGIARITVIDHTGTSLQGIKVISSEDLNHPPYHSGFTNSFGVCTFKSLPTNSFQLLLGGDDYFPVYGTFSVTSVDITDREFHLEEGGSLLVSITDINGNPVDNAKVSFPRLALGPLGAMSLANLGFLKPSSPSFRTDSSGSFSISPLPTGTVSVSVSFRGFSKTLSADIFEGQQSSLNVKLN